MHSSENKAEMEATGEQDSAPNISGDTLSPEMHAALHAAKEQQQGAGDDSREQVKRAIDEALKKKSGESKPSEDTPAEPAPTTASAAPTEEMAAMKEQLIRTMAEMENLRKRHDRDMGDARKYAITGFARDLVNVAENLQLALINIPAEDRKKDEKLGTLAQGVEMTYNELIRVFQSQGIVRIDPKGEKFNHNHHQAVAQVEDPTAEPGTVVQVLQAGYIIHDRLLRPAMVAVAKAGDAAAAADIKA